MTLDSVLNDYLKARKDLKEFTVTDYKNVLRQVMPDNHLQLKLLGMSLQLVGWHIVVYRDFAAKKH